MSFCFHLRNFFAGVVVTLLAAVHAVAAPLPMPMIVGWLRREAGKRRLPFSTWLARWLVRWAIRLARQKTRME